MDDFAKKTDGERRDFFQEAANRREIAAIIVEKDFWVCWTLKRLFTDAELKPYLTFKGGTSLSKAYGVIERFSEDIDLTISRDTPFLADSKDPMEAGLSGKELERRIDGLKRNAQHFVAEKILPNLGASIGKALGQTKGWSIALDENDADKQTILFHYPAAVSYEKKSNVEIPGVGRRLPPTMGTYTAGTLPGWMIPTYIQPVIRLEFGARGETEPSAPRVLTAYVAETFPDLFPARTLEVPTLAVERTFWEKATILHALYHGVKLRDRMSRHYYDTYMLMQKGVAQSAMADPALLERVVRNKSLLFRDSKASYETARIGSLKLVPDAELTAALKKDYAAMAEMFMGDAPDFETVMKGLAGLEKEINEQSHAGCGDSQTPKRGHEAKIDQGNHPGTTRNRDDGRTR